MLPLCFFLKWLDTRSCGKRKQLFRWQLLADGRNTKINSFTLNLAQAQVFCGGKKQSSILSDFSSGYTSALQASCNAKVNELRTLGHFKVLQNFLFKSMRLEQDKQIHLCLLLFLLDVFCNTSKLLIPIYTFINSIQKPDIVIQSCIKT